MRPRRIGGQEEDRCRKVGWEFTPTTHSRPQFRGHRLLWLEVQVRGCIERPRKTQHLACDEMRVTGWMINLPIEWNSMAEQVDLEG